MDTSATFNEIHFIIMMKHLPLSAQIGDIREFFSGLLIPRGGVKILGGEHGIVFIGLSTFDHVKMAIRHSERTLHNSSVSVVLSNATEMESHLKAFEEALKLWYSRFPLSTPLPFQPLPPVRNLNERPSVGPDAIRTSETSTLPHTIRMFNLHPLTNYRDIRRFFNGLQLPRGAITLRKNQRPNHVGEAIVEFHSHRYASEALQRNGKLIRNFYVFLEFTS